MDYPDASPVLLVVRPGRGDVVVFKCDHAMPSYVRDGIVQGIEEKLPEGVTCLLLPHGVSVASAIGTHVPPEPAVPASRHH